jgi:hypothetical protein
MHGSRKCVGLRYSHSPTRCRITGPAFFSDKLLANGLALAHGLTTVAVLQRCGLGPRRWAWSQPRPRR